ncbi:MAG TPA: hypothetical protein VMY05_10010 [Acidobacteriota bacterium]|nr:hypothetical protein [Acidobacteriota bacterium]
MPPSVTLDIQGVTGRPCIAKLKLPVTTQFTDDPSSRSWIG